MVFVFHLFLLVHLRVYFEDCGRVSVVWFAEASGWVSLIEVTWPIFLNVHSQFLSSWWDIIFLDVYFLHLNLIWINWCLIVFVFLIRAISTFELKILFLLLSDVCTCLTLIGDRLWFIRIFLFWVELLVLATFDAIKEPKSKILQECCAKKGTSFRNDIRMNHSKFVIN